MVGMLADEVLPLIRPRADLHRWNAANSHGDQMHVGVDILEEAMEDGVDPVEVYQVTHKAVASAMKVIARADDSSGIIGDACRRLLELHPVAAASAAAPPTKLADWMIAFQFHGDVDYFTIDPVAYAPALGEKGMAVYRRKLTEIEANAPKPEMKFGRPQFTHERFTLEQNAQRLAVLDRDVDAIIRTHARNMKVPAWLEDTSKALEEIGEIDLAIEWAGKAVDHSTSHQSLNAARTWCRLLEEHRPDELLDARLAVFRTWPTSPTAAALFDTAGEQWESYREEVMSSLETRPTDAVSFALGRLRDPRLAWELAHSLELKDQSVWSTVLAAYGAIEPLATLPMHRELVEADLAHTKPSFYRSAALRLRQMRRIAAGTPAAADVDAFILETRAAHRRRTRMQQEFDRCKLP